MCTAANVRVKPANLQSTEALGYYYEMPDLRLFVCEAVDGYFEQGFLRFKSEDWQLIASVLQYLQSELRVLSNGPTRDESQPSLPGTVVMTAPLEEGRYDLFFRLPGSDRPLPFSSITEIPMAHDHSARKCHSVSLGLDVLEALSGAFADGKGVELLLGKTPADPVTHPRNLVSFVPQGFDLRIPKKYAF